MSSLTYVLMVSHFRSFWMDLNSFLFIQADVVTMRERGTYQGPSLHRDQLPVVAPTNLSRARFSSHGIRCRRLGSFGSAVGRCREFVSGFGGDGAYLFAARQITDNWNWRGIFCEFDLDGLL